MGISALGELVGHHAMAFQEILGDGGEVKDNGQLINLVEHKGRGRRQAPAQPQIKTQSATLVYHLGSRHSHGIRVARSR
jgi:hypothetical protein